MSSRKLLVLLDGLPDDSWYKVSGRDLIARLKDEDERNYASGVRRVMFAQLTGQKMATGS